MAFRFEQLTTYEKMEAYADACIEASQHIPRQMQSSLGDQLRRSAVSIISNVAEGSGKQTGRSEVNYYDIAHGSVAETVALLRLFRRRQLIGDEEYGVLYEQADEISSILWSMRQSRASQQVREDSVTYSVPELKP